MNNENKFIAMLNRILMSSKDKECEKRNKEQLQQIEDMNQKIKSIKLCDCSGN